MGPKWQQFWITALQLGTALCAITRVCVCIIKHQIQDGGSTPAVYVKPQWEKVQYRKTISPALPNIPDHLLPFILFLIGCNSVQYDWSLLLASCN